jgi:hypothetical protein
MPNGRSGELVASTRTNDEEKARAWAADWLKQVRAVNPPPPAPSSRPVIPGSSRTTPAPLPKRERSAERGAELVNRLRGVTPSAPPPLGDVPPPPPPGTPEPELLAPGVREEEKKKEQEEELDMEANEMFADMAAGALVGGHLRAVKRFAANQDPPRKAEEPNEMCLEWERAGVAKKMKRLFGKSGGMSENTKLLLGIAGVTLSMLWDADVMPAAAAPARPAPQPQPRPQPAPAPPPAPPAQPAQPARALAIVPSSPPPPAEPNDAAAGKF